MSEGPNVEIKIAATGGDEAAAEVRKVAAAAEAASKTAGSSGFGGMLDGVPEKAAATTAGVKDLNAEVDELIANLGKASDETKSLGAAADDAGGKADKLGENVEKIARAQKAQAVAQLAEVVGNIGAELVSAGDSAKDFDAELASSMKNAGRNIQETSSKLGVMAAGFAVGGPVGAGLAAVGGLLKDCVTGWFEMAGAMDAAAAAEARATEMQGKLSLALAGVVDPALAAGEAAEELAGKYDLATQAIERQIDGLRRRNALLDAKDESTAATRDREDATAIDNGQDPFDVQARRATDDAKVAEEKIDRELELKRTGLQEKFERNRSEKSRIEGEKGNLNADPKILADDEARLKRDERDFDEEQADYGADVAASFYDKRTVREKATGTVERLAREKAAAKRKADDADKRRKNDEDAKAKKERMEDELEGREAGLARDSSRASARFGENAGKLKGHDKLKDDLSGISKSLEDGTDTKELAALSEKFKAATEGMGGAIIENMSKMLAALDVQAKQIAVLGGQIKNNRR